MQAVLAVVVALVAFSVNADVIDDLLAMPVPRRVTEAVAPAGPQPPPPDDAPFDELVDFWSFIEVTGEGDAPSPRVRDRLVDVVDLRPNAVGMVIQHFPASDAVCARVKQATAGRAVADNWLLRKCASERTRLIAAARSASDDDGGVAREEDLRALAEASWNDAEPLLVEFAGSWQPRLRALALAMLFEHGDIAPQELQSIAVDLDAPGYARDLAIRTLSLAEWSGRDEWLIELASDPTLLVLADGDSDFYPIDGLVYRNPDEWIPVMARLAGSSDRAVRSAAANALVNFPTADALRPLVPWLADPAWAEDAANARQTMVQAVAGLGMTDAIPGLVAVIDHDDDPYTRAFAARAIAELGDTRANIAMRMALDRTASAENRTMIAAALIATGGLLPEELASCLEHVIRQQLAGIDVSLDDDATNEVVFGTLLQSAIDARDDVAQVVLDRVRALESTEPSVAAALMARLIEWNVPSVNAEIVARIERGTADAAMVAAALTRRESFRRDARRLLAKSGFARGFALVMEGASKVGAGENHDVLRAMLAAARYTRDPLPIDGVAHLFGRNRALDAAAEAYLVAEDSAAARAIVEHRHPAELLILGEAFEDVFEAWERELLARFRESGVDEIIALAASYPALPVKSEIEIVIRGTEALVNGAPLDAHSLAELRSYLAETRFEDLAGASEAIVSLQSCEYVHLTRTSGRRVFLGDPSDPPHTPYETIGQLLRALAPLGVR